MDKIKFSKIITDIIFENHDSIEYEYINGDRQEVDNIIFESLNDLE